MKLLNSVANQIPTPPRRPSRLTPYLFFLLFALIAGVTYLGGLPPADPSVSSAPSALNPTAASTATPQYVTKEIRDVRIFDWVLATNPELTDADRAEFPDIEPDNWRLVSLAMPKQDGSRLDISLARPVSWLQANRVAPGTTIDLDLPEMGAQGPAQVRSVRPCPPVSAAGSPMSAIGSDQRERTTSSERQLQLVGGPCRPRPQVPIPAAASSPASSATPRPTSSTSPGFLGRFSGDTLTLWQSRRFRLAPTFPRTEHPPHKPLQTTHERIVIQLQPVQARLRRLKSRQQPTVSSDPPRPLRTDYGVRKYQTVSCNKVLLHCFSSMRLSRWQA